MLTISMLQTPSILLDGQPVVLPFKRADALVYYLAVNRTASRQELIALLWEGEDEAKGLKNLRNALYTIKKALGGDILLSPQKATIRLNPQWEIDCDYDRFTRQGDFSAYHGPFLSGFSVRGAFALDEWIFRTREKLHMQYLQSLQEQARLARREQRYDDAIRMGQSFLAEEPYDEAMAAFLMQCFKETSQFARAIQIYQKLKDLLSREMGADPLESTTMLYYEILNHWTSSSKPLDDPTAPVGREQAYDALRAAVFTFRESSSRRCSQLLLGEPGSGKSELINQFLRTGDLTGLFTVRCECMQSDSQKPLSLWSRLLRPIFEFLRAEGISVASQALERISKAIALFDGLAITDQLPYDRTLEDSVLLVFSQACRQKKALVILDDLHLADIQSIQLLSYLLRHLERGSLMLILSSTWACQEATLSILKELEADELLHRQLLDPLTKADTALLLRRELGDDAAMALAEPFYHESGGNLKLLMGLVLAYRQNPDVSTSLKAVNTLLLDRLVGLSEQALLVIRRMSVFRDGLSGALLLELTGGQEHALNTCLLELRRRGILEEVTVQNQTQYRFLHKRLQSLVYERLSVFQRKRLHSQAACLLAGKQALPDAHLCREISWHFQQAEDKKNALQYRILALEQQTRAWCEPFAPGGSDCLAHDLSELVQEADSCQQALFALSQGVSYPFDEDILYRLTLSRGRLALYQGDTEQATAILGTLGTPAQTPLQMAHICELLAFAAFCRQSTELTERYVSTGLRYLTHSPDPMAQARLYRLRGCCFYLRGDYDRGGYYVQEAIDLLEQRRPDPNVRPVLAACYADLGRGARCRNDFLHAGRWFKKAQDLLKDQRCAGQVWIYVHYGRTVFSVDDHIHAKALFAQALELARHQQELWGHAAAAAYCAYFQMTDGDDALAAQTLQEAMACAEQMHAPLESGILNFVCMKIRRRLDLEQRPDSPLLPLLPDSADEYARRGMRLCRQIPDVFEMQMLSKDLRDSISSQLRYRSSELYSKNKRFMSE